MPDIVHGDWNGSGVGRRSLAEEEGVHVGIDAPAAEEEGLLVHQVAEAAAQDGAGGHGAQGEADDQNQQLESGGHLQQSRELSDTSRRAAVESNIDAMELSCTSLFCR